MRAPHRLRPSPIGRLVVPYSVEIGPDVVVRSLADTATLGVNPLLHATLLDAARRAQGSVSYVTLGNGHASHVVIDTVAGAAEVQMLHVPFKDAGALLGSVAAGDVDLTATGMNGAAGLMASGCSRWRWRRAPGWHRTRTFRRWLKPAACRCRCTPGPRWSVCRARRWH